MTTNVHPNFKSCVPHVTSAQNILDIMGYAFDNQNLCHRWISPHEKILWNQQDLHELQNIYLEVKQFDRLYAIQSIDSGSILYLLGRMKYKQSYLFIEFKTHRYCNSWEGGYINVTKYYNLFYKFISWKFKYHQLDNMWSIYQSLCDDGYYIERNDIRNLVCGDETSDMRKIKIPINYSPPSLQNLCYITIYTKKQKLQRYHRQVLPKLLTDSVEEFKQIQEASIYPNLIDRTEF